jgi:tRNA-uridine aminocarboxypropyltransferase
MSDTLSRRPTCARCALPARMCLCALVVPVRNELDVLVLQHPGEVDQAKGSLRLLRLSLARCRVVVGETFEPAALRELLGGDVSGSALLYPAGGLAGDGAALPAAPPRQLVVLDGTWRKSLRMLCANPLLQSLPRWAVAPSDAARYAALRKAPRRDQLSTLEATCAALASIEGVPARYAPLLDAFGRFVADRAIPARPAPAR